MSATAISFFLVACAADPTPSEPTAAPSPTSTASASSAAAVTTTSVPSTTTPSPTSVPDPTPKVIALSLDVTVDGNTVKAAGAVDLPDGTKLFVGLDRTILDPSRPEGPGYYTVDFAEAEVHNGRYSYELVDQRAHSATEFVDAYNIGEPAELRQHVGPNVQVTVSFSPRTDGQTPAAIAAAGGRGGGALETSPQATRIGGWTNDPYWTLKVEQELAKPIP